MDLASIPLEWPTLALMALLLGLRHGYDADHLAAVDGMTRSCNQHQPALARAAGLLFSLGHGTVVMVVAVLVSLYSHTWQVPAWLESTGAWISIVALIGLAGVNGYMLCSRHPDHHFSPLGWRSVLLGKLLNAQRPATIWAVGALFALSFDTISQATLFAMAATKLGGWWPTLSLAAIFTLGMVLTDGLNGAVVAGLMRRADARAHQLSRAMGWAVVAASLLTGLVGLVCQLSAQADTQLEPWGWLLSLLVMACVLGGFLFSQITPTEPKAPHAP